MSIKFLLRLWGLWGFLAMGAILKQLNWCLPEDRCNTLPTPNLCSSGRGWGAREPNPRPPRCCRGRPRSRGSSAAAWCVSLGFDHRVSGLRRKRKNSEKVDSNRLTIADGLFSVKINFDAKLVTWDEKKCSKKKFEIFLRKFSYKSILEFVQCVSSLYNLHSCTEMESLKCH